jgi:hypothetical protein
MKMTVEFDYPNDEAKIRRMMMGETAIEALREIKRNVTNQPVNKLAMANILDEVRDIVGHALYACGELE